MSKTDSLHYQLCCEGAKWLFRQKHNYDRCKNKPCHIPEFCSACKKYNYVAVELCTWDTESADVWGLGNFCDSSVIEVKVSHADFKADQKKWHRSQTAEAKGMQAGRLRWYLCPEGVIKPEELPDKWGLLYWDGKKIRIVVAQKPFENTGWADINILASLLRRENFPKRIFNYRGFQSTIRPKTINGLPAKEWEKMQIK